MNEDRATQFLNLIKRSQRGRLKVYLGYGPGVGKTTLMLQEAQRLKADGIDAVVGVVETHGRAGTARWIAGLEVIPRRQTLYRGIAAEEMDLAALLARKPQVALVDELAHTNVPGSRNDKRYQDVQDLLAAGIHVISTLNVQHLESLYDTVEKQIGVKVRERIPDAVVAEADQLVNVDLAPEDLQRRLTEGHVYPMDRVPAALEHYFKTSNLEQLRELTLRELAAQIDFKRRELQAQDPAGGAPDQIAACLSSRGPNSARLLRFASRLAGRLNRTWYAVYVQTPTEDPLLIDAQTQRQLSDTLTLANQLGATVFTFKGADVAETILRFCREYRVGQVVIGKPRRVRWWSRLAGARSVAERLIGESAGLSVVVVDVEGALPAADAAASAGRPAQREALSRAQLLPRLEPRRVRVWRVPIAREEALRGLIGAIAADCPEVQADAALRAIEEREGQGSTFLNDGFALPHARLSGLRSPQVAFGVTAAGLSDLATQQPMMAIVLILTPTDDPKGHLQLLAAASRLLRNREFIKSLDQAATPEAVVEAIRAHEAAT
jgi:two-component system sensor histidine kinase KdpD